MYQKSNVITCGSQIANLVTVGIDMGGALWATGFHDWTSGHDSYRGYRDSAEQSKEAKLYEKVQELITSGHQVQVFYEAGRYGYAPARKLQTMGAKVSILPVNKLKVIMCGKVIKTDKLDAKFLAGLHPDKDLPEVYIPTLDEEGRRDAERELIRLKQEIGRLNAQLLSIIERTELKTPSGHRRSSVWKQQIVAWNASGELGKLPGLMTLRLSNMIEELELTETHLESWQKNLDQQLEKDRQQALNSGQQTTGALPKSWSVTSGIFRQHHLIELVPVV